MDRCANAHSHTRKAIAIRLKTVNYGHMSLADDDDKQKSLAKRLRKLTKVITRSWMLDKVSDQLNLLVKYFSYVSRLVSLKKTSMLTHRMEC